MTINPTFIRFCVAFLLYSFYSKKTRGISENEAKKKKQSKKTLLCGYKIKNRKPKLSCL